MSETKNSIKVEKLLSFCGQDPITAESIVTESGYDVKTIKIVFRNLEKKGKVKRLPHPEKKKQFVYCLAN
jgi:predicted Rossmann fold nucleotide-binding protein DprA/Smf involved in DNA uptake